MSRVVLAAVFAVMLASGARAAPPVGATAVIDRPVAIVGEDEVIWLSELEARIQDKVDRAQLLEQMIEDRVVVREGKRARITVEASEVSSALDEIKKQNNLDDAALDKILAQQGYTRASYKKDIEQQILILRTKNQLVAPMVIVTDAEIDAEAKKRNKKLPLKEADKQTIQSDLRKQQLAEKTAKWLADVKQRARIERKP